MIFLRLFQCINYCPFIKKILSNFLKNFLPKNPYIKHFALSIHGPVRTQLKIKQKMNTKNSLIVETIYNI